MIRLRICLIIAFVCAFMTGNLHACPFCSAVSQTFSEEIKMMDVVALTKLKSVGKVSNINTSDPQAEVPKSTFVITKVIKGGEYIKVNDTFDTIYFGESKKDRAFLAMATDPPGLVWSSPLILSDRAEKYLGKVKDLPESFKRLEFFQDYLEDEDEMLARDAYDEFAKAPYDQVIALKPKMNRARLLSFIKNPDVPSNRRRLYFTMLGVCGTKDDAVLLQTFMESKDRKAKAGLDAMLACYVILTGEAGLDKVDELFLKNQEAEYADTYAAIMAIRFHGAETKVVPRTRLVKSLRHMLDRPELADLVIPDLARWEDWDVMPKLTELFITADENSSWVRVPVINYLRACPLPVAKEKIEQLKLVDADSVKRAMTFFPISVEKDVEKKETESNDVDSAKNVAEEKAETIDKATLQSPQQSKPQPALSSAIATNEAQLAAAAAASEKPGASSTDGSEVNGATHLTVTTPQKARLMRNSSQTSINPPETLNQIESRANDGVNTWTLLGVTALGGCLCFATMRSILGAGAQA